MWLEVAVLKRLLSIFVTCTVLCFPIPAWGQSAVSNYVAQLEHQGYTDITMQRTMLGRTKITASRNGTNREIVVARNGQVLFDYRDTTNRSPSTPAVAADYGTDKDKTTGRVQNPVTGTRNSVRSLPPIKQVVPSVKKSKK